MILHSEIKPKVVSVYVYKIPCDQPESDGTLKWDATTMILVEIEADNRTGIGYTYSHQSAASIIEDLLAPLVKSSSVFDIPRIWNMMIKAVRNIGSRGIAAHAISAVDVALWDLKGKLLDLPLCRLWGMAKEKIPVYGSGGFTSYSTQETAEQFIAWQGHGIDRFKMKVGRIPSVDTERVKDARNAIGPEAELFVDANGAYSVKEALNFAYKFHDYGVTWFEEPVSSENLKGLRFLRKNFPPGMCCSTGEYGYETFYFKNILTEEAVDVLQADATRCCGYTGFFTVSHLCHAFQTPLSSHTAPSLHLHACLSVPNVCHMEYFHDHVRIESLFFEGFPKLEKGFLIPHLKLPGHGLSLKKEDVKKFLM